MRYSPLLLILSSTLAWSEISTLTASELTDTYIKDTTVIVRPEQVNQDVTEKVRVKLKVSPIEETIQIRPSDDERHLSAISEELNSYTELSQQAELSANLQLLTAIPTSNFLAPPPSEEAINKIRAAYGIDHDEPIDLTNLSFIDNQIPTDLNYREHGTYSTTPNSFTITIPNTGNFNSQNIASPNGEIGVNVTPSHIEYTLNLPK